MNALERLLSTDPNRQKSLRELARIHRSLQLCKKRLQRAENYQPILSVHKVALYECLEKASAEVYQISCDWLGISDIEK